MQDVKNKTGRVIPVVFATDEKYAPYLGVAITSLAENLGEGERCSVTVMHVGLDGRTVKALEGCGRRGVSVRCLDVSEMIAHIRDRLYSTGYISPEMYYRALIPELFPCESRVIYLDCDIVVRADIAELYSFDMGEFALLGAKNPMHPQMQRYVERLGLDPGKYINSGVLLLNCDRLREMSFTECFFSELSKRRELSCPDQDIINLIIKDKIGYLPAVWNYIWHLERLGAASNPELRMPQDELSAYTANLERAKIVHFTGDMKPWVHDALRGSEYFYRYAELSPMKGEVDKRRREALSSEEKIKLVFFDFEQGAIRLTCAHVLAKGFKPKHLSYTFDGREVEPEIYFTREQVRRGISMEQRLFSFTVPRPREGEAAELRFLLNGSPALFEYEKFFPLNGFPQSYCAIDGTLVYRDGRRLCIEHCERRARLSHEIEYLRALARAGGKRNFKYILLRMAYPALRRLLPKHVWLLSDRPEVAGDNAEALFTHLSKNAQRGIRPYFVIRRESSDFRRLKRVGRVVSSGSLWHKLLSVIAEVKAVSQTDAELYEPVEPRLIKDILIKQTRVFLQHGVTKDDISSSYSRFAQGFELFVTAAYPEYFSVIENPSYGLDPSRVVLTGFPRHDILGGEKDKIILVCPTWRKSLLPGGRVDNSLFRASRYYAAWHSLLSENALPVLAARYGYRVVFLPHRNTEPYLGLFRDVSPSVELVSGGARYAELISAASLTLTDYSSVAFESAFLGRPVVYYQFDEADFFASHTVKEGYFDSRRDGFGEVAVTEGEVLGAVERVLQADCALPAEYVARREGFFAFRDDKSSGRVVDAIIRRLGERERG